MLIIFLLIIFAVSVFAIGYIWQNYLRYRNHEYVIRYVVDNRPHTMRYDYSYHAAALTYLYEIQNLPSAKSISMKLEKKTNG